MVFRTVGFNTHKKRGDFMSEGLNEGICYTNFVGPPLSEPPTVPGANESHAYVEFGSS